MKNNQSSQGFTLIELAIVISIIGLIVGTGMVSINPMIKRYQLTKTRNNLQEANSALLAYSLQKGNLPCPSNSTKIGKATCENTPIQKGFIPWQEIGLERNYAIDGFGRMMTYYIDSSYTNKSKLNCLSGSINWQNLKSDIKINDASNTHNQDGLMRPAYVLISHGENGKGAIMPSGAKFAYSEKIGTEEAHNSQITPSEGKYNDVILYSDSIGGKFDDVIISKTATRILLDTGCLKR